MELGRVTFELSSNMATITDHRVRRAQGDVTALASAGEDDDFDSENVLDGWRGDILSQLMDLWSMVLGIMNVICALSIQNKKFMFTSRRYGYAPPTFGRYDSGVHYGCCNCRQLASRII